MLFQNCLFDPKFLEFGEFVEFGDEWFFTVASSLRTPWLLLSMYSYLLHCIPIWIQMKCLTHPNKNEWIGGCLKWFGWVELNDHNTFPSWMMYLKHHHKWSRSHSWKNRLFIVFIWQFKGIGTYPQYVPQKSTSKDRKLISIAFPIGSWIVQVQSIPFW